jgi:hypothetical protein
VSTKGKHTKILNFEVMDETGTRITGTMFGDDAKPFFESLHESAVYLVSKGQVKEEQFQQNNFRGNQYSQYALMMTGRSEFKVCEGNNLVPQASTTLTEIQEISQNPKIGQLYDVPAILLSIHDPVEIPKQDKTVYKLALEICDPVNELMMEAIIWNRNFVVDEKLEGKAVGLYGFKLSEFKDGLSLSSTFSSEIRPLETHPYCKYEGRVNRDRLSQLSEQKQSTPEQPCKNLEELDSELAYLTEGQSLKSTLTLAVTYISHKKWEYEGCPHCHKKAEPPRCENCYRDIDETVPRYNLNIELSDCCGSLWATGFNDIGTKIFESYPEGIKGIKELD